MTDKNKQGISLCKDIVNIGACSREAMGDDWEEKAKELIYREMRQAYHHRDMAQKYLNNYIMTKTVLTVLEKMGIK